MTAILQEIISLLTGGITGIATGIGQGLSSLVTQIFVDTSGDSMALSMFGGTIIIFAGVGLAIGLSTRVVTWLSSLGN